MHVNCEQIEGELAALLFDELEGGAKARVEAHVAECAACREELARMKAAVGHLKEHAPESAPTLETARVSTIRRRAAAPVRAIGSSRRRLYAIGGLAAAASIVAVALPVLMDSQSRTKPSRAASDRLSLATSVESYFLDGSLFSPGEMQGFGIDRGRPRISNALRPTPQFSGGATAELKERFKSQPLADGPRVVTLYASTGTTFGEKTEMVYSGWAWSRALDPSIATDAMTFRDYGVNPFVVAADDPFSTFAVDVDTASYAIARRYLEGRVMPPGPAIRVEEIVNYFPYRYAPPSEDVFAVYSEIAPSPFGPSFHLVKIGVKGREVAAAERKPVRLTFVIDVSGSMQRENRLGLVQRTLRMLVATLRPDDMIGIATFNTSGREALAHTAVREAAAIHSAIDSLAAGGSTNAHEGLNIGYAMARRVFHRDAVNRVILCSDGVANTGTTHPDAILADVARSAGDDIYLTAIGVGMGNYNDVLLEQLADRGNGHYGYLDDDAEAERFIREHLGAGMEVIAQDVKIQVEFDPSVVAQYRLLGFENREVADADFTNDAVDAGEIGAGHQVTALYEIEWVAGAEGPAGTVRVRALPPGGGEAMQIEGAIALDGARADFHAASADFKLAAIAAEYAEIMRNSYWARGSKLSDVAARFDAEFPGNPPSPQAAELRMLIERAATVPDARPAAVAPWGTRPPADTDDNPPPGAGGRIDMRTPPPNR